jgi:thiamine pyrophosphokinase
LVIVGGGTVDLDSLAVPTGWAGRTRLIRIAEQQTTDFEKVLYSTRAPVTVALGMTGGRFDHTLAALDVVARHARERHIVLVDATDLAFAARGAVRLALEPGERVSVHPLGRVRFARSEGLLYPLDGLEFAPGEGTGTSNAATEDAVVIEPEPGQGPWLLILRREHLGQVIAGLLEG